MFPVIERQKLCNHILKLLGETETERNLYFYDDKNKNLLFKTIKIGIDIIFSLTVIIFFSWLLISISLLIKLNSRGPILFIQERVGEGGCIFKIYKFRTMKIGTRNVGTHKVDKKSITTFGRVLRKTKLDELPQIINILFGQMSLIAQGPDCQHKNHFIKKEKREAFTA